eukprot:Nk52_evm18s2355 gene=Nk52_evmTU18s2355
MKGGGIKRKNNRQSKGQKEEEEEELWMVESRLGEKALYGGRKESYHSVVNNNNSNNNRHRNSQWGVKARELCDELCSKWDARNIIPEHEEYRRQQQSNHKHRNGVGRGGGGGGSFRYSKMPADTCKVMEWACGLQPGYCHTAVLDVVLLWVNGSDPYWQRRKQRVVEILQQQNLWEGNYGSDASSIFDARFRELGQLKMAFRSLAENAPWARRIFLVTDGQVPDFLDLDHSPRLRHVTHSQLWEWSGVRARKDQREFDPLPLFNSIAIQAMLHSIPTLSSPYALIEDDMLLRNRVPVNALVSLTGRSESGGSSGSFGGNRPGAYGRVREGSSDGLKLASSSTASSSSSSPASNNDQKATKDDQGVKNNSNGAGAGKEEEENPQGKASSTNRDGTSAGGRGDESKIRKVGEEMQSEDNVGGNDASSVKQQQQETGKKGEAGGGKVKNSFSKTIYQADDDDDNVDKKGRHVHFQDFDRDQQGGAAGNGGAGVGINDPSQEAERTMPLRRKHGEKRSDLHEATAADPSQSTDGTKEVNSVKHKAPAASSSSLDSASSSSRGDGRNERPVDETGTTAKQSEPHTAVQHHRIDGYSGGHAHFHGQELLLRGIVRANLKVKEHPRVDFTRKMVRLAGREDVEFRSHNRFRNYPKGLKYTEHGPSIMWVDIGEALWWGFEDLARNISQQPFRHVRNSWDPILLNILVGWQDFYEIRYERATLFKMMTKSNMRAVLEETQTTTLPFVCINDDFDEDVVTDEEVEEIRTYLEDIFPRRSEFEW